MPDRLAFLLRHLARVPVVPGLGRLRRLLVPGRRLPVGALDEALLDDLGLSRGELVDALRRGRMPRRGY